MPNTIVKLTPNNKECLFWEDEVLKKKLFEKIKATPMWANETTEDLKKERRKLRKEAREKNKAKGKK